MARSEKIVAMILAAGFGKRLRPLTESIPKPLIPIAGRPLIDYHLDALAAAGFDEVIINLHWLGEKIEEHVGDGSRWGLKASYTRESEILGTGGGIKNAEEIIGDRSCLIINGDIWIDLDIDGLLDFHFGGGYEATMALRPLAPGESYTPVMATGGLVRGIETIVEAPAGLEKFVYLGVQIISPVCIDYLRPEFSSVINDYYGPALRSGARIGAFRYSGWWSDLGTPERYAQAKKVIERRTDAAAVDSAADGAKKRALNRLLGVDYGEKRIGLALSDRSGVIASPLKVIEIRGLNHAAEQIIKTAAENEVEMIVIGLPLSLDGSHGPSADAALSLAEKLRASGLPVDTYDERFTTTEAERTLIKADVRRKKRKKVIDKMAASLILQSYLDHREGVNVD